MQKNQGFPDCQHLNGFIKLFIVLHEGMAAEFNVLRYLVSLTCVLNLGIS